jgi:hypothetical protein
VHVLLCLKFRLAKGKRSLLLDIAIVIHHLVAIRTVAKSAFPPSFFGFVSKTWTDPKHDSRCHDTKSIILHHSCFTSFLREGNECHTFEEREKQRQNRMENRSSHRLAALGDQLDCSLSEQCVISILLVTLLIHAWTVYEGFKRRRGASALSASLFQQPRMTTRGRRWNSSMSLSSSSSLANHLPKIGLTLTQDHLDPIASRKVCV